jgi:membrane-associated protein
VPSKASLRVLATEPKEPEENRLTLGSLGYLFDPNGLLSDVVIHGGLWVYGVVFAIVFAETGLVFAPFLPGDSLLFATGALAGAGELSVWTVCIVVSVAAIAGDAVNYAVGRLSGGLIIRRAGRFVKPRHIEATQVFFEKHGAQALVLARFIPFVRTFAPFVAGMGGMTLGRFWRYNIAGALAWVALFVGIGYFFGTVPWVERNLTLVILACVVLPAVPVVFKACRHHRSSRKPVKTDANEREESWTVPYAEKD